MAEPSWGSLFFSRLLSHHGPEHAERCTQVAGQPVCRRCLALYPATLLVMGLQATPLRFSPEEAFWLAGLGVPATLDFVLEQLGRHGYHPGRVVLGAVLLSLPLGYGLSRYIQDPHDPWFWRLVLGYGIPAGIAVLVRGIRMARGGRQG